MENGVLQSIQNLGQCPVIWKGKLGFLPNEHIPIHCCNNLLSLPFQRVCTLLWELGGVCSPMFFDFGVGHGNLEVEKIQLSLSIDFDNSVC